jgi:hypothetical protein
MRVDVISGFNVWVKIYNHLFSVLQNVKIKVHNQMDRKQTTQGK